jgi:hypothetical protein
MLTVETNISSYTIPSRGFEKPGNRSPEGNCQAIQAAFSKHPQKIFSRYLHHVYGDDLKCRCIGENGDLVPLCIPEKLFDISKEVSADALSVFWSENKWQLYGKDLSEL